MQLPHALETKAMRHNPTLSMHNNGGKAGGDMMLSTTTVDDETEANIVWKEILARKGLPLDTPYEYINTFDKTYDESYCDRLFATVRERKKNPEAAKSWGKSIFEWLPAPNYNRPKASSSSEEGNVTRLLDKKPEKKKFKSLNRITYADAETKAKRKQLFVETREKNAKMYKEYQAKGGRLANMFTL